MSFFSSLSKHPRELWILSLTELCERFAFWGVGNLLVLYLVESYHFQDDKATQVYAIFTGCAAFLPFVGGWIADRWNYQAPILLGALINAVGCFLIASGIQMLLYLALFCMALGYGIFTPSILTVLGYTYRDRPSLREAGFSIYYASINIGVFLALFSMVTIAQLFSWNIAFMVAGFVQIAGLIPLILYLVHHKETYQNLAKMQKERQNHPKKLNPIEKDRVWVIAIFCLISILFWAAYNQGFSSMEIFAHQFMNQTFLGKTLPEGVFLSSESFFLILLAPLLAALYAYLQKKHEDPSPAIKTSMSLFFMAGCFLVMMFASFAIPSGATSANVPSGYLISAYFLMAISEMLLAPIGLSMISRLSPARYTATAVGLWYVCIGIAFFSGGFLAGLMDKVGGIFHFFAIFVILALVPGILMLALAKKLTKLSHTQEN